MADRAMTPSALWLVAHQSQCLSLHMKQLGGLTTAKTGKKSLFGREATEVKRDRDNKQKLNTEKTEPQTGIY